ncbi:MAG: NADH-quinone oxidoreductase subunit J [Candidatus Methanofastidiosia archaeon]
MFYLLAIIIIFSSLMILKTKRVITAAVFLALSLFGVAGLYILLSAYFIAAIQLLIYVGGVMVLIVFGIFLTGGEG